MDNVVVSILVLLLAFVLQYCWQLYKTSTDEEGVIVGLDHAESVYDKMNAQY
jgi:lipopolysaccharide export system protein LptC